MLGALRILKQSWVLKRSASRVVEHNYGPVRLSVEINDPMAESWYDNDWLAMEEVEELSRGRLRPGARVFDLGAHQGVVALVLSRMVGPEGSVIALEPVRHNLDVSRRNAARNGADNLALLHAAVSDHVGVVQFDGLLNSHVGSGLLKVPSTTVDALSGEYGFPDVVYLDVEGAEQQALTAATETLRYGCDWFVEVHTGAGLEDLGGSVSGLLGILREHDYGMLVASADRSARYLPLEDADASLLERRFALIARPRT